MITFWKNKKVIVTGAGGFIGRSLCLTLNKQGAKVTAVSHKPVTFPNLSNLQLRTADLTDISQIDSILDDHVIVIHCAALDGGRDFKIKFANTIFQTNVLINDNLITSMKKKNIEKFIFISSAEVYQGIITNKRIKEDDFKL